MSKSVVKEKRDILESSYFLRNQYQAIPNIGCGPSRGDVVPFPRRDTGSMLSIPLRPYHEVMPKNCV